MVEICGVRSTVLTHAERCGLVERSRDALALRTQATLLGISRRSLDNQPVRPSDEEVLIKHHLAELYTTHPLYGSRKLMVGEECGAINRNRGQRSMRELGIAGLAPSPNVSKRQRARAGRSDLLRDVTADRPNQVWGCDITSIRLQRGWLYLVAILNSFSCYVISWALDEPLDLPCVLEAIAQARTVATPEIWNTEQGSQFPSPHVTPPLAPAGIRISVAGKAVPSTPSFRSTLGDP